MAKGGARQNAGRKAGQPNKLTQLVIEKAKATGDLPHEFLLKVSQGQEIDGVVPDLELRLDAAKAAAPFFAPRLAQIEQKVETELRATISAEPMSEHDWERIYGNAATTAGLLGTAEGAAEESH